MSNRVMALRALLHVTGLSILSGAAALAVGLIEGVEWYGPSAVVFVGQVIALLYTNKFLEVADAASADSSTVHLLFGLGLGALMMSSQQFGNSQSGGSVSLLVIGLVLLLLWAVIVFRATCNTEAPKRTTNASAR